MMESIQIANLKKQPIQLNSTLDEHGRVRVLSFDLDLSTTGSIALEELLLARLPAGKLKVIQLGLNFVGIAEDTTIEVNVSRVNEYDPLFTETSFNLLSDGAIGGDNSIIFNLNHTLESLSGLVVSANISTEMPAKTLFNGYLLYIID